MADKRRIRFVIQPSVGLQIGPGDGLRPGMCPRSRTVMSHNDQPALLVFAGFRFVHMFIGMHAPMPVMALMHEDLMEKHAEAVLLGIV